ncbi:hypothetical protein ACFPRL_21590 [Pseudoclavibacter helvolus]
MYSVQTPTSTATAMPAELSSTSIPFSRMPRVSCAHIRRRCSNFWRRVRCRLPRLRRRGLCATAASSACRQEQPRLPAAARAARTRRG